MGSVAVGQENRFKIFKILSPQALVSDQNRGGEGSEWVPFVSVTPFPWCMALPCLLMPLSLSSGIFHLIQIKKVRKQDFQREAQNFRLLTGTHEGGTSGWD